MSIRVFVMSRNVEQEIINLKGSQTIESYFHKIPLDPFFFAIVLNKNEQNAKIVKSEKRLKKEG